MNDANFASYVDGNTILKFLDNIDKVSASMSLQLCHYKYGHFSSFWITK